MGAPRGRMCPSFATSLAVAYSISSLGTVLAYDAVPYMADSGGVGVAMWAVGSFPCYLSLLMTLLLPWVELYVIGPRSTLARSVESSQRPSGETADYGVGVETRSDGVVIDDRVFDGDFDERDGGGGGGAGEGGGGMAAAHHRNPSITSIFHGIGTFSWIYWWLILFIVGYLASQQVWSNFATDIFVERFQLNSIEAGRLNSIPNTIGVLICPLLGMYVDHAGNTIRLLLFGSMLLVGGHVVLCFFGRAFQSTELFACCEMLLGLGVGIVQAALWPTVASSVPPELMTTAMGIAAASSNTAMVIFPLLTGFLHDVYGNYSVAMYLFVAADLFCLVLMLILLIIVGSDVKGDREEEGGGAQSFSLNGDGKRSGRGREGRDYDGVVDGRIQ